MPGKTRSFFVLLAGVMLASPVRAEDAGLPQLDTSMFPEQLFWLAISFAFLYLLMSRLAMPRIEQVQGNRRAMIAAEIEMAHAANTQAKEASAQLEKSLADARAQAQASVDDMVSMVTQAAAEGQSAQERQLGRRLHEAEEKISVMRENALSGVHAAVSDLASAVVEKVLSHQARGSHE